MIPNDLTQFLDAMFPGDADGYVDLRAFGPSNEQTFIPLSNAAIGWHDVQEFAQRWAATHDVYFGVAPRVPNESGVLAGKKDNVKVAHSLWADLDFKLYLPPPLRAVMENKAVPASWKQIIVAGPAWGDAEQAARTKLAACQEQPSMIVHSGGGLHAYWFVDVVVADTKLEETNARLAAALGSDPSVADWTRILRLPGTFNHKPEYGISPRPVTMERSHAAR
jgi:hypothetical protein